MEIKKAIYHSFNLSFDEILKVIDEFDNIGSAIKKGRNVVKVAKIGDVPVVIKSFERIMWFNRIIYCLFRKSKAQRAYENAVFLIENDILTPLPVAFVDFHHNSMLRRSYFISLYVDCKSSDPLFNLPIEQSRDALVDFAKFTYKLHCLGLYHGDYSPGNVLYSSTPNGFEFYLIDNNRIKFKKYSKRDALRNMSRIILPLDRYAVFVMEYSRLSNLDVFDTAKKLLTYMQSRKAFFFFKVDVKNFFKRIFNNKTEVK